MDKPEDAERAFYEAFVARDTDAMMRVWAHSDAIVCIHPGMGRLKGVEAVRASWAELFGASRAAPARLQIQPLSRTRSQRVAVHAVIERFATEGESGLVFAVNAFHRDAAGWHLVSHHASPGWTETAEARGALH
ncbi:YybH family protein [Acidihalobacter prosperus]|uniref:SnoaL-like domain-containing protein n=1 Tax=Acidihalobacter prosperus TaxID=160660 RepID=A0A1A6C172_9GAMM|nr:nuclear transport factor 2 family protein [Acidihalobacter prosperus]OBS08317.1 hypothetical protein Thpro_022567 [Acidihalobacter prosperus]